MDPSGKFKLYLPSFDRTQLIKTLFPQETFFHARSISVQWNRCHVQTSWTDTTDQNIVLKAINRREFTLGLTKQGKFVAILWSEDHCRWFVQQAWLFSNLPSSNNWKKKAVLKRRVSNLLKAWCNFSFLQITLCVTLFMLDILETSAHKSSVDNYICIMPSIRAIA